MRLAAQGYALLMHGRNPEKLQQAVQEVTEVATAEPELFVADFARLEEVARLADEVASAHPELSVLVNNAGLLTDHRQESADGYELTFAVNYLAPVLLTRLLLPTLKNNPPARIVNVASTAMGGGRIDFKDLQFKEGFDGWDAYANSKLANVMFSNHLAAQISGSGVVSNALCPGLIDTNFFHTNTVFANGMYERMKSGMRSPEQGADIPVHMVTNPDIETTNGRFYLRRPDLGMGDQIHAVATGSDVDTMIRLAQETDKLLAPHL